jgi:cation transport ATPase
MASVFKGHRVRVGRPAHLTAAGIDLTGLAEVIHRLEDQGHTAVAVGRDAMPLGVLALADTVRPKAAATVAALRAGGIEPVLVTGEPPSALLRHRERRPHPGHQPPIVRSPAAAKHPTASATA